MKNLKLPKPSFNEELLILKSGYPAVAGLDEVGRGAFAGPIVAACVILPLDFKAAREIYDSKMLLPHERNKLSAIIMSGAIYYSITQVNVSYINKYGIGKANHLAFRKLIHKLSPETFLLVDGFAVHGIRKDRQKAIIKGDQKSISIAAASIIAKVYRDTLMENLPDMYKIYNFKTHKGYGTRKHRETIAKYGLCDLHRTSFRLGKYL